MLQSKVKSAKWKLESEVKVEVKVYVKVQKKVQSAKCLAGWSPLVRG